MVKFKHILKVKFSDMILRHKFRKVLKFLNAKKIDKDFWKYGMTKIIIHKHFVEFETFGIPEYIYFDEAIEQLYMLLNAEYKYHNHIEMEESEIPESWKYL